MYSKYKSPSGYFIGSNNIDTYGVDHSTFSTRDELAYQMERQEREDAMLQLCDDQRITSNYPQYTTNFWGQSADNNYGFGMSNIGNYVRNVIKQLNNPTNNMWQKVKDISAIVADTIRYTPESLGELAADTQIAYDYWQQMKRTGRKLVNTYGSGQGNGIDNYYHPLLQCELAKISPASRRNGIVLGYLKEYLMDYPSKRLGGQSHDEIMEDSIKDLQNNLYGSNLGYNNQNKSCTDLLDDKRTGNMRKLGIK